jgi:hypothetical protein
MGTMIMSSPWLYRSVETTSVGRTSAALCAVVHEGVVDKYDPAALHGNGSPSSAVEMSSSGLFQKSRVLDISTNRIHCFDVGSEGSEVMTFVHIFPATV